MASWRSSTPRHAWSPTDTARSVDPTMSVKSTVASTRSAGVVATGLMPGEELLDVVEEPGAIAPSYDHVVVGVVLDEASAREHGRRCSDPTATGNRAGHRVLCSTRVGAATVGRIGRTSISMLRVRMLPRHAAASMRHARSERSRSPASGRVGDVLHERTERVAGPPPRLDPLERAAAIELRVGALGVVGSPRGRGPSCRTSASERTRSGIRRGEQQRQRTALRDGEQRRPLEPDRVDDGADVVHPLLEAAEAEVAIREPGPALVEHDAAREPRRSARGSAPNAGASQTMSRFEMKPGTITSSRSSGAERLVRDPEVAALGVADLVALVTPRTVLNPGDPALAVLGTQRPRAVSVPRTRASEQEGGVPRPVDERAGHEADDEHDRGGHEQHDRGPAVDPPQDALGVAAAGLASPSAGSVRTATEIRR